MDEPWFSLFLLIGRFLLALVYLVSGIHKGIWYQKAQLEFRQAGIPLVNAAIVVTVTLHLGAALLIIAGPFAREAALALVAFTTIATFMVHDFWNLSGMDRLIQSRIALAHMAIVGGLLFLAAMGPGRFVLTL